MLSQILDFLHKQKKDEIVKDAFFFFFLYIHSLKKSNLWLLNNAKT